MRPEISHPYLILNKLENPGISDIFFHDYCPTLSHLFSVKREDKQDDKQDDKKL
jgi:hypothetical protein